MAMQVIVRISVTMAVHWTKGTILQMNAPMARKEKKYMCEKQYDIQSVLFLIITLINSEPLLIAS